MKRKQKAEVWIENVNTQLKIGMKRKQTAEAICKYKQTAETWNENVNKQLKIGMKCKQSNWKSIYTAEANCKCKQTADISKQM